MEVGTLTRLIDSPRERAQWSVQRRCLAGSIGEHVAQPLEDVLEDRVRSRVCGPAVFHERAVVGRHVGWRVRLLPAEHLEQYLRTHLS